VIAEATRRSPLADGGQRVVHAAQHLHGGIGVDRDYPLHRYFLWAKELELTLGGANPQLLALGAILAAEPVGRLRTSRSSATACASPRSTGAATARRCCSCTRTGCAPACSSHWLYDCATRFAHWRWTS